MVIPWKHLRENHYDHVHMRSRAVLSEDCTVCIASNWGERSEPPPSVADEGLVYIYIPTGPYVHS